MSIYQPCNNVQRVSKCAGTKFEKCDEPPKNSHWKPKVSTRKNNFAGGIYISLKGGVGEASSDFIMWPGGHNTSIVVDNHCTILYYIHLLVHVQQCKMSSRERKFVLLYSGIITKADLIELFAFLPRLSLTAHHHQLLGVVHA